jgi:hypothetical protein
MVAQNTGTRLEGVFGTWVENKRNGFALPDANRCDFVLARYGAIINDVLKMEIRRANSDD